MEYSLPQFLSKKQHALRFHGSCDEVLVLPSYSLLMIMTMTRLRYL